MSSYAQPTNVPGEREEDDDITHEVKTEPGVNEPVDQSSGKRSSDMAGLGDERTSQGSKAGNMMPTGDNIAKRRYQTTGFGAQNVLNMATAAQGSGYKGHGSIYRSFPPLNIENSELLQRRGEEAARGAKFKLDPGAKGFQPGLHDVPAYIAGQATSSISSFKTEDSQLNTDVKPDFSTTVHPAGRTDVPTIEQLRGFSKSYVTHLEKPGWETMYFELLSDPRALRSACSRFLIAQNDYLDIVNL